jgi:hypothetical protein
MLQVNFEPTLKLTCPNNYLTCVKKKVVCFDGGTTTVNVFLPFPPMYLWPPSRNSLSLLSGQSFTILVSYAYIRAQRPATAALQTLSLQLRVLPVHM